VVAQIAEAADGVTPDDPAGLLWDTLELTVGKVSVAAAGTAPTCSASLTGYTTIASGTGLDTPFSDATEDIVQGGTTYIHYCFVIYLPTVDELEEEYGDDFDPSTLQGRAVAPAWQFVSTSD
jgi:hypothetical protein